jgi:protein-disulfide isomerase
MSNSSEARQDQSQTATSAQGQLLLLDFGDLQCPDTARWHAQGLPQLKQQLGSQVRYAYHDFPLDSHPVAGPAAAAVHCAGDKGGQLRDALLANLPATEDDVVSVAERTGLDAEKIRTCMQQEKSRAAVAKDRALGDQLGVRATPTLVVAARSADGQLRPLKTIRPDKESLESVLTSIREMVSSQGQ